VIALDVTVADMDRSKVCCSLCEMMGMPTVSVAAERFPEQIETLFPMVPTVFDCDGRERPTGDRAVSLGSSEFPVLRLLARHVEVLGAATTVARVWDPERVGDPDWIKLCVYRLSEQIEPDPGSCPSIRVRRGRDCFDAEGPSWPFRRAVPSTVFDRTYLAEPMCSCLNRPWEPLALPGEDVRCDEEKP
jgi:hypothetical protein